MNIYEHIEAVEMAASNLIGEVVVFNQSNGELVKPNPNDGSLDRYGEVEITDDRYGNLTYRVTDARQRLMFDLTVYEET
jgi:hypothetical protein